MSNIKLVNSFKLPTYTNVQSLIRTKLETKVPLSYKDLELISKELYTSLDIDFNEDQLKYYLDNKYPTAYELYGGSINDILLHLQELDLES